MISVTHLLVLISVSVYSWVCDVIMSRGKLIILPALGTCCYSWLIRYDPGRVCHVGGVTHVDLLNSILLSAEVVCHIGIGLRKKRILKCFRNLSFAVYHCTVVSVMSLCTEGRPLYLMLTTLLDMFVQTKMIIGFQSHICSSFTCAQHTIISRSSMSYRGVASEKGIFF